MSYDCMVAEIELDSILFIVAYTAPCKTGLTLCALDNASFHHTERIAQMCADAGVKLIYQPPYSPDINPIEEFFAELKAFIKRSWSTYEEDPAQGFNVFLEWCVEQVGSKEQSARGHFRHSRWTIGEV